MNKKATRTPAMDSAVSAQLNSALSLFQAGKHDEADELCLTILRQNPQHFDAIHLLGIIKLTKRQYEQALGYLERALSIRPNDPEVEKNRGIAANLYNKARITSGMEMHKQGQFALAEPMYLSVLELAPLDFDATQLLGALAVQRRQYAKGIAYLERALAIKPDHAETHYNHGVALQELKRAEEALASFDRALVIQPNYAEAHYKRGVALQELKRVEEALASHDRVLAIKPDHAEAHYRRGIALWELKQVEEALASYDRALAIKPGHAEAHNNRGVVLQALKRVEEALDSYDRSLAINPAHADAQNNRGVALRELKRVEEALASYDRTLTIRPDHVEAHYNRGIALWKLKRVEEALASFARALAIKPDYAEAHWNESLCRLLSGDFAAGWQKYEWRWQRMDSTEQARCYPQPLWLGADDLTGKTILLYGEQGFGDTLQFSRYVPYVAARGATVVLEVPPALVSLLSHLEGKLTLAAKGSKLPPFDLHCPLMSLPLAFAIRLPDVTGVPYLRVPESRLAAWSSRLPAAGAARVGLVWSGSTNHKNDADRSIGLGEFKHLLVDGHDYFCLQKEIRESDHAELESIPMVQTFASDLTDFADTAALVDLMDVVVTVDTSVAHLAGALGKEVWILLPYVPDWRWLLDRSDSPWYDSATLFRQSTPGDWSSVICNVRHRLQEMLVGI